MELIRLLNLAKYAKVFLIITTAISITAAAGLTAASCKSVNCTTFLFPHKPATILIFIINMYVFLIRQNFLDSNKQKAMKLHHRKYRKSKSIHSSFLCLNSFHLIFCLLYVWLANIWHNSWQKSIYKPIKLCFPFGGPLFNSKGCNHLEILNFTLSYIF